MLLSGGHGGYLIGATLMLAGLAILRGRDRSRMRIGQADRPPGVGAAHLPDTLLDDLLSQLTYLGQELPKLPGHEITARIAQLTNLYINPALRAREHLFARLGKQQAALVLLTLTHSRDTLNQLLRAATRGAWQEAEAYHAEALLAVRKAHAQFH